jgi:hypothetical protein
LLFLSPGTGKYKANLLKGADHTVFTSLALQCDTGTPLQYQLQTATRWCACVNEKNFFGILLQSMLHGKKRGAEVLEKRILHQQCHIKEQYTEQHENFQ